MKGKMKRNIHGKLPGIINSMERRYKETTSEVMKQYYETL